MTEKYIPYSVDGRDYKIPESKAKDFEDAYPTATIKMKVDDRYYKVPFGHKDSFLKHYSNATYAIDETSAPIASPDTENKSEDEVTWWDTLKKGTGGMLAGVGSRILNATIQATSGTMMNPRTGEYFKGVDYEDRIDDMSDPLVRAQKKAEETSERLAKEADPTGGNVGYVDLIKEGKFGTAMQKVLADMIQSAPMTLAAYSPYTMAINAVLMASDNYAKETRDNPEVDDWKRMAYSVGGAAIEQVVEKFADPIFKYLGGGKEMTEDIAKELLENITKESADGIKKRILKTIGRVRKNTLKDAGGEGLEEIATSFGNDALGMALDAIDGDKDYGISAQWEEFKKQNPNATKEDFAEAKAKEYADAFIGGALSSVYMSVTAQTVNEIATPTRENKAREDIQKAHDYGAMLNYDSIYDTDSDVVEASTAVSDSFKDKDGNPAIGEEFISTLTSEDALMLASRAEVSSEQRTALYKLAQKKAVQEGLNESLDGRLESELNAQRITIERATENGKIVTGQHNGKDVFIKGATINKKGKISLPNGPVLVIDMRTGEQYAATDNLVAMGNMDAAEYEQKITELFTRQDALKRDFARKTMSPKAKLKAIQPFARKKILVDVGNGITEVFVESISPKGEVMIKGKKGDLGGQSILTMKAATFYDSIHRDDDGNPVVTEVEQGAEEEVTDTPVVETTEDVDYGDYEGPILVGGRLIDVMETQQDKPSNTVNYTYVDENGDMRVGSMTIDEFGTAVKQAEEQTKNPVPAPEPAPVETPEPVVNEPTPTPEPTPEPAPEETTEETDWDALFENDTVAFYDEVKKQFGDKAMDFLNMEIQATQNEISSLEKNMGKSTNERAKNFSKLASLRLKLGSLNEMAELLEKQSNPVAETPTEAPTEVSTEPVDETPTETTEETPTEPETEEQNPLDSQGNSVTLEDGENENNNGVRAEDETGGGEYGPSDNADGNESDGGGNQSESETDTEGGAILDSESGEENPVDKYPVRNGDVTQDMVKTAFGFSYVTNSLRSQKTLNTVYDTLMGMAKMLGISPKSIGHGGRLGLSRLGDRVDSSTWAWYERGKDWDGNVARTIVSIRDTHISSLLHEWWHSLDHALNYTNTGKGSFTTSVGKANFTGRQEVLNAVNAVMKAIKSSGHIGRIERAYYGPSHERYLKSKKEATARAFEEYILGKFAESGIAIEGIERENISSQPTAEEMKVIAPAFDKLFKVLKEKEGKEAGTSILYHIAQDLKQNDEVKQQMGALVADWIKKGGNFVVMDSAAMEQALMENGILQDTKLLDATYGEDRGDISEMLQILGIDKGRSGNSSSVTADAGTEGNNGRLDEAEHREEASTDGSNLGGLRDTGDVQKLETPDGTIFGFVKDGVVYLDPTLLNPNTSIHEYTHLWDNALMQLNPALWEKGKALMKKTSIWKEVINDPNYADIKNNEDLVASEVHSRLVGIKGAERLNQLEQEARAKGLTKGAKELSILGRLREWINEATQWLKDAFTAWSKEELDAVTLSDFLNMPLRDLANFKTLPKAEPQQVINENGELVANDNGNGKIQFSISTWRDGGRDYLVNWLKKDKTLTKQEKEDILARMDEFYENAQKYTDVYVPFGSWSEAAVKYDKDGNPLMSVIKKNGDYSMNLDFSLVCKKRRPLNKLLRTLINRNAFGTYSLRERELAEINWILQEHGFEVACALCFVDSKRYRVTGVADVFAELYNKFVKALAPEGTQIAHFNYSNNPNIESVENGLDTLSDEQLNWDKFNELANQYEPTTVEGKVAKFLRENPSQRRLVDATDFIDASGFEAVKEGNPALLSLYNSKKGTGGPKASFGDVQYLNDILKKSRSFTAGRAYDVGGVRLQSFSDFVPHMYFDYMQLFAELTAKKLPAHAYTKEVLFAKIFGLTGLKINMSLVPAVVEGGIAPGLDANGNYAWADAVKDKDGNIIQQAQSFPFDEAMTIQNAEGYSKNCGVIAVGISDEHIEKMLNDPNIPFIIPYHKSSLNAIVARMTNIDQYKDYTNVQNTKKADGTKLDEGAKDFNFNAWLRKNKGATPKDAAQAYLDWCKKNNYRPKFSQFAYHPNYYKLLVDFNTVDARTGEYTPQGAVTMTFPTGDNAFGDVETLIQQGLQEDAELEEKMDSEIEEVANEVEQRLAEIKNEPEMSEKEYADKMAELADERMARIKEKAEDDGILSRSGDVTPEMDAAYMEAVDRGDMETAQRMVDEAADKYLNEMLLPDDSDEVGFKYHRGPAPTKTFKRYAVFNVKDGGFHAAYAGNATPTPVGVWLDAQNLQSYTSDMVQFDDGTFATYIAGDTGAATNTKFTPEKAEELGVKGSQKWLLERGGKHSSDVPNFSQMNLKTNEKGEKVSSAKDGALPHNKLIFEIEYGVSEDGDLTDYVRENGRMMKGKNQGLAKIGENQYYDFKTNPNAVGNWGIGGTFRITRLVPHSEVVSVTEQYKKDAIAEANRLYDNGEISKKDRDARVKSAESIQVQKWVGGYNPADFGLSEEVVKQMAEEGSKMKLTDPVTYDDNGNVIPLSKRFNSENPDIRYRRSTPVEFHQLEVDNFLSKYNPNCEVIVFPINERTAKAFGYTLEELKEKHGRYIPSYDFIAIFAREDLMDRSSIEDTLFHESIHKLAQSSGYEYMVEAGKWMWENASNNEVLSDYKEIVEEGYKNKSLARKHEEMLCHVLAGAMESGHVEWLLKNVSEDTASILNEILNEIGYESAAETRERRARKSVSQSAVAENLSDAESENAGQSSRRGYAGATGRPANAESERRVTVENQNASVNLHTGETRDGIIERAVSEEAQKLGVNVTFSKRSEMAKGHETDKGYYNTKTGEIVICPENNASIADTIQTILHEAVAHKGLRQLMGDKFDEFINRVYDSLDAKTKEKVDKLAKDHYKGNKAVAMEEYMATLAESEDFNDKTTWDKIVEIFEDIINKILDRDDFTIGDKELRYILRASYNNMANPRNMETVRGWAQEQMMREEYKINKATPELLSRTGIDPTQVSSETAKAVYDRVVSSQWQEFERQFQDAMQPVRIAIDAIQQETGNIPVEDYENYILIQNHASSRSRVEIDEFERRYFGPIVDKVNEVVTAYIKATGGSVDNEAQRAAVYKMIKNYLIAKHGLERNQYYQLTKKRKLTPYEKKKEIDKLTEEYETKVNDIRNDSTLNDTEKELEIHKEAEALRASIIEVNERLVPDLRDYSGLTTLFGFPPRQYKKAEEEAKKYVADIEKKLGRVDDEDGNVVTESPILTEMWDKIKSATDKTLRHSYECGLLSRGQYEEIKDMFTHYIPLRGYDETTAEDVYSYSRFEGNRFNPAVQTVKGRTSLAEDPLAIIMNMAESEIAQGNKNRAKQALYNYLLNRSAGNKDQNSLMQIESVWYLVNYDEAGNEYFTIAAPNHEAGETYEEFEARMIALEEEEKAFKSKKGKVNVGMRFQKQMDRNSHYVYLKVNGVEKAIYINGDPKAADAINGTYYHKSNAVVDKIKDVNRFISSTFTNYSLSFTARNFVRDAIYSRINMSIRESDPAYRKQFRKNYWHAFGNMRKLIKAYRNGELDGRDLNPEEAAFVEFMRNGGQTGYTVINSVENHKKELERAIKRMQRGTYNGGGKSGFIAMFKWIELMNESSELLTRFVAYKTSRDMGRGVETSIGNAKEITVNFNTRGAQDGTGILGGVARYFGWSKYFFNASVQGVQNLTAMAKANKIKFCETVGGIIGFGFAMPFIHALASLWGDDDENEYWNIPEYDRQNNICIQAFGTYIKIPLPIGFREMYAIGDTMAAALCDKKFTRDLGQIGKDMANKVASIVLPINPLESAANGLDLWQTGLYAILPSGTQFAIQNATNIDWKGAPLQKEYTYNEHDPQWTKAFASNPKWMTGLSKWCNENINLDGDFDGMDWSPEKLDNTLSNVFGGMYSLVKQTGKSIYTMFSKDKDFNVMSVPLVGVVLSSGIDEDDRFITDAYYDMKEYYDENVNSIKRTAKAFGYDLKEVFSGENVGAHHPRMQRIYNNRNFDFMQEWYAGNKELESLKNKIEYREKKIAGMDEVPNELIEEIAALKNELENERREFVNDMLELD